MAEHDPLESAPRASRPDGRHRYSVRRPYSSVWLNDFWGDVRQGARVLRHKPSVTLVAILTLALGVGVNATLFDIASAVLLRPLPFEHPERLIAAFEVGADGKEVGLSAPDLLDWRRQTKTLAHLEEYFPGTAPLTGDGDPETIRMTEVTLGFFDVFGARPLMGVTRTAGEDEVVISEGLWRRRFGAAASVVGASLMLDGHSMHVAGVMPSRFDFPRGTEVWAPQALERAYVGYPRRGRFLRVVGDLEPGVSLATAQTELRLIAARLSTDHPKTNTGVRAKIVGLHETLVGNIRPTLILLSGAAGLVLLIALCNVANLLLVLSWSRRHEMAVRAALGASRGRLVRQVLTEAMLIALAGAALGVMLSYVSAGLIRASGPIADLPIAPNSSNLWLLAFACLLVPLTLVLVGVPSAMRAAKVAPAQSMRAGGRGATAAGYGEPLIAAQTAFAALLLLGATLAGRSLSRLRGEPMGFDAAHVIVVSPKMPGYALGARRLQLELQVLDKIRAIPGVSSAAITNSIPLKYGPVDGHRLSFIVAGRPATTDDGAAPTAGWRVASDKYFQTMRVAIKAGREFDASDRDSAAVVIINQAAATAYWPGQNPVGATIAFPQPKPAGAASSGGTEERWFTIRGVVEDIHEQELGVATRPAIYFPVNLLHADILPDIVVRTELPLSALRTAVRSAVADVSHDVPVQLAAMSDVVAASVAKPRLRVSLGGLFALLAVILASIGIYGVAAHITAQRTREIGIRLALGARPTQTVATIMKRLAAYAGTGLIIGLGSGIVGGRYIQGFLYGISATDPLTFAGVAAVVCAVIVVAGLVPARRATRIDPITSLRSE